jgi:hypothetical protein
MPLDLLKLEANEAERIAYAEGFTMAAELFRRIADLEFERDALIEEKDDLHADLSAQIVDLNARITDREQFFYDCFDQLAKRYPSPDFSSDYDKSVIFDAIQKGEGLKCETEELESKGLPVRYFILDCSLDDGSDLVECDEFEFLRAEGRITYERHTVRENGCNQICLTKGLDA